MIPIKAQIQQTQFAVLQSSVATHINKKNQQINLSEIPLEIDYDIYFNNEIGPHVYRIVMTLKGNSRKAVSGYVFTLKIGGEYRISEDLECESGVYNTYVHNTGVACLINEARVYLQTLTAFFPFGVYIMPMIDMTDLMKQHYENQVTDEIKIDS